MKILRMNANKFLFSLALALGGTITMCFSAMAACIISTTAVSFGTYDVFSPTPRDSTGSVVYRCGTDANITISLDRGGAPSFNPRRMLKGTEALDYNLYQDAARTTIWGDGTGGTQAYFSANPPNNKDVTVTIHGRIPAGQDVGAGAYTNTVTAIVNF